MPSVTLLTVNATHDDLATDDYRQIYDELRDRGRRNLRDFVELIGSAYSIAWWSRYETDQLRLTRTAKNELRAAVALPKLPAAVAELLSDPATVNPNAAVYRLSPSPVVLNGGGQGGGATRVVLIGEQVTGVDIYVNSDVSVLDPPLEPAVTAITSPTRRAIRKTVHLSPVAWERLNAARTEAGYSWEKFVSQLLTLWETPL